MATVVVFFVERQIFFRKTGGGLKRIVDIGGVIFFFVFFFGFLRCCVSLTQSNYDDKLSSRQKLANLTTYTVQNCLEKQLLGGPSH